MHLQADPSLAEVPGFSSEQLATLARSIELKKQRLESDIHAYIKKKQCELHACEQELLAQYRETLCGETQQASMCAESQNPSVSPDSTHVLTDLPESPAESSGPEGKKRTKHTRVHKREKELFGLITPIFLPLLDAGEPAPAKRKEKKRRHKEKGEGTGTGTSPPASEQGSPSRDVSNKAKETRNHPSEGGDKIDEDVVMQDDSMKEIDTAKEKQAAEARKRSKRPTMKKSSLRKNSSGERSRRKRVSLVIDDQIVLPADEYQEPPLTSPSETTISSNSASTNSLDDMIDPRLLPQNEPLVSEQYEHEPDAEHHSLPYPMHNHTSASPPKHTPQYLSDSPLSQSPPLSPTSTTPYEPPSSFDDIAPPSASIASVSIPHPSSFPNPIFPSRPELAEAGDESFSTYVGGPSGSGVDNVDQTGSLGYPSSLGASYMESYMQSRPLSVRMAAAEKAGLDEEEKELLRNGAGSRDAGSGVGASQARPIANAGRREERIDDDDDEMDVIGSMEGF